MIAETVKKYIVGIGNPKFGMMRNNPTSNAMKPHALTIILCVFVIDDVSVLSLKLQGISKAQQ